MNLNTTTSSGPRHPEDSDPAEGRPDNRSREGLPPEATTHDAVIRKYHAKQSQLESSVAALNKRWASLGLVRGLVFICFMSLLILGFISYAGINGPWYIASGAVLLVFLVVAFIHVGIEDELFRKRLEVRFTKDSIKQLNREWDKLPVVDLKQSLRQTAVANDLDFFGRASLMQLVCSAETPIGQSQLVDWMVELPDVQRINLRQAATRELKDWETHRDKLRLLGRLITTQHSDPSKFLAWANRDYDNVAGTATIWFARIVALYHGLLLLVFAIQLISLPLFVMMLAGGLAVSFMTTVLIGGQIHAVFNEVAARQQDARHYLTLFSLIGEASPTTEYLKEQKAALSAGSTTALAAFSILERRMALANLRRNGLFYVVYLALQFLFLWDVHALVLLRNWRSRFGKYVPAWFEAIGKWEAAASLAKVAADHPEWVFPEVRVQPKQDATFAAQQLGHPLLSQVERVCNDVSVGPPGSILLVTGSNMSGKSTMLRSIGLNIVLAQLGTVVCARELKMPCIDLQTSIRISDSLADGVSYYFAELKRLKEVVVAAELREPDADRVLLYLLDEILQGTNSRERQIAVSKVLEHLVDSQAIGAISTHDLELASADSLKSAFRPVHFRETITTENHIRNMTFDYQMRQGIATTTNALELLRMVGLGDDDDESVPTDHGSKRK